MDFDTFATAAADLESIDGDLEATSRTADLLGDITDDAALRLTTRFLQGRIFPGWDDRKIDIGDQLAYEAIAKAAGGTANANDVEDSIADIGEVGAVADDYISNTSTGLDAFGGGNTTSLTLDTVYTEFERLADVEGSGSESTKVNTIVGLLNKASSTEAKFLVRLVLGEMRIGVGEGTVRDAISEIYDIEQQTVARAIQVSNDYGEVTVTAKHNGASGLDEMSLEIGRPVQAMLAQDGSINDAFDEYDGTVAVDTKFDGARVQIHTDGDAETEIYSRRLEEVTAALPEVVEYINAVVDVPAVIDGEVIPVDDTNEPEPFQEILRRFRRKHDVEAMREEVNVKLLAFDALHIDGVDLLEKPLQERHAQLCEVLPSWRDVDITDLNFNQDVTVDVTGVADAGGTLVDTETTMHAFEPGASEHPIIIEDESDLPISSARERAVYHGHSNLRVVNSADDAADIEAEALESGHEGIMLKNPDATYTPGKRGKNWLKVKPDVETLDLVVTGAEWGEGRRAELLGAFMLSAKTDSGYATIGKVGTGITDEELEMLTERLEPHITSEDGTKVEIEPAVIFEIGHEEIQSSPTYESGYGLRFPRFIGMRDDIGLDDVDTVERITELAETN
ncbi:DNA ligase [Salinibaculum rarum]|uniref:ATP-dependent DNA ligase n=1 Tax=Salinibaculum rarum TaxID=3058903 RepID=UPI0034E96467